jgi:DUF1009 family protein
VNGQISIMVQFDPSTARVAIIAGNGHLPGEAFRELERCKRNPLLIGISGEVDEELAGRAAAVLTFGQLGRLFEILLKENIHHVIFAGGIRKRPDFKRLKLDLVTIRELPTVLKIVMGGDNTVLEKISAYFEKRNLKVVGVHEALPELLAEEGNIAGRAPLKIAGETIDKAVQAAKTIGAIDAGQAAICEDGRVIALEGAEGTDAMIARVADLRMTGRIAAEPKVCVLAKVMKPKQDMRADLPSIGPETITNAVSAGIRGVVLEAGRSLVLNREETLARARKAGIFILGVPASEGTE